MDWRLPATVALLLFVVSAPLTAGVSAAGGTAATADGDIHQRKSLALTPSTPGEFRTTLTYELPDSVGALNVTPPEGATVRRTEGFEQSGPRSYEWDGTTAGPTIVLDLPANRSFEGGRRPPEMAASGGADGARASGSYSFVDTGSWAIVRVPGLSLSWRYSGSGSVGVETSVEVDGEGATGGEIAYLGPETTHVREANGQRFRLVVPAAASLREEPAAILESMARASGALVVGERDPEVFVVAAPAAVDWGPLGVESGGSDAWVRADARLDWPTNVWLHEYVHTRQAFRTTRATAWLTEASADYYAAVLSLRQGLIGFDAFRDHLRRGTRSPYAGAVLAEPDTWAGGANYLKGALVYGVVDLGIRLAGERSVDAVLARLNADPNRVSGAEFLDAVGATGDTDVRETARRYSESGDAPEPWSREEHGRAFPSTGLLAYDLDGATVRASGPYRNRSVRGETLVTGETLRVSVPVTNAGDRPADYEVSLDSGGRVIARDAGRLGVGNATAATLTVPLETAGNVTLSAGPNVLPLTVRPPARPQVQRLAVSPARVRAGSETTVRIAVTNPAPRPANGTVELTVDGEAVADRRVALDAGETVTVAYTLGLTRTGEHTLRAGDRTATLVVEPTPTPTATPRATDTTAPATTGRPAGLGWPTLVAALALALLFARRR